MENNIVQQLTEIKEATTRQEYSGEERRKTDDPAHFGHFCLEGLERRQSNSIFSMR